MDCGDADHRWTIPFEDRVFLNGTCGGQDPTEAGGDSAPRLCRTLRSSAEVVWKCSGSAPHQGQSRATWLPSLSGGEDRTALQGNQAWYLHNRHSYHGNVVMDGSHLEGNMALPSSDGVLKAILCCTPQWWGSSLSCYTAPAGDVASVG